MIGAHLFKNIKLAIETLNGSLGHGLGFNRLDQKHRRVFCMMGDGECSEGSIWEAANLAYELGVSDLVGIVNYDKFRNDGLSSSFLLNKKSCFERYSKCRVVFDLRQCIGDQQQDYNSRPRCFCLFFNQDQKATLSVNWITYVTSLPRFYEW